MNASVGFSNIPADYNVPLFCAEMDPTAASYFVQNQRTLIFGQKLAAGAAVANVSMLISRTDDAKIQFGEGSMLAMMHEIYRLNDSMGEVWCIALDDNPAGVAAAGSLTVTGPASGAGVLNLYIGKRRVQIGVAVTEIANDIAAAIAAAINADTALPVTATVLANVVTVTARNKGTLGDAIKLQLNYRGAAGGEVTPAGVGVAIAAMSGGAGDPSLAAAHTAMGDEEYDFIIHPYTDSASLDAFKLLMNDQTGRWAYDRLIYGHVYTAKPDTFSGLVSQFKVSNTTSGKNDPHSTIWGYETAIPNTPWECAAAYGARNAVFLSADCARPTQTGELIGILPARAGSRFITTERKTLLNSGIATGYVGGGVVRVERAITNYQKNSFNQTDPSLLDSETLHTYTHSMRRMKASFTTKYPRHKLANDGTRFAEGQPIMTPRLARGEILSEYAQMEEEGIVENFDEFDKHLIVVRNAQNPNRLDILYPPDFINQLRIIAVVCQFRLQYPV